MVCPRMTSRAGSIAQTCASGVVRVSGWIAHTALAPAAGDLSGGRGLVVVTGHASASMTPDELESHNQRITAEGRAAAEKTAQALRDLPSIPASLDTLVVNGDPGPTLCRLAADVGASALIVGSRGRGGLKRALLGSVSDYVVRNAPCSVIVSRAG